MFDTHSNYYLLRAEEEERLAAMSTVPVVRDTHAAFAAAYRDRATSSRPPRLTLVQPSEIAAAA